VFKLSGVLVVVCTVILVFFGGWRKTSKKRNFHACPGISVTLPWISGFGAIYEGFGEEERVEKMRKTMFGKIDNTRLN